MTPVRKRDARAKKVLLTRKQLARVIYEMGWEWEDEQSFWRLAIEFGDAP